MLNLIAHLLMRASFDGNGVPSLAIPIQQWIKLWEEMKEESEEGIPYCNEDFPYRNVLVMGCEVFPMEDLRCNALSPAK